MTTTDASVSFADLGLRKKLLEALAALGYEEPTPIQAEAIPQLLAGRDLLGQAATGTGKTAAFALPMLSALKSGRKGRAPVALVLVPTRELCIQVSQALHRYGRDLGVRVLPIYGGQPIGRQLRELNEGVDMVVATPGRAVDHLKRGTLDLTSVATVVLDEADEMLDMGFADDLEPILDATPVDSADRAVLRDHAGAAEPHRAQAPDRSRSASRSSAPRRAEAAPLVRADARTWSRGRTSRPRSDGSSTSSRRRQRSSSAARAPRSSR